jgi:hypothetical protein
MERTGEPYGDGVTDRLRLSSAECEAAIAALGEHFAHGRLNTPEYEERVDAVVEALVRGDLRPLFEDLPLPRPPFLLPMAAFGGMPEVLRATLAAEGVLLLEENLPGTITFRRYRTETEQIRFREDQVTGTIVITARRLLVWAAQIRQIDVAFSSPLRAAITISAAKPDRLHISYEAASFNPKRSGQVELRFHTGRATAIADLLG